MSLDTQNPFEDTIMRDVIPGLEEHFRNLDGPGRISEKEPWFADFFDSRDASYLQPTSVF